MLTIDLRSRAAEKPRAKTVKPFARIVTGAKEPRMTETYRGWQTKAVEIATELLNSKGEDDMSVAAGVGSGKTLFACGVSEVAMAIGRVEQVIVVTINRRCQRQWAKRMRTMGIMLKKLNGNAGLRDGLPPDCIGYITTYAGMGKFPDLHAAFCGAKKTIVIFDEVHHINDDEKSMWGKAARDAFSTAEFRLCLSGTFFSSNGSPIPFARMIPVGDANNLFEYDPHVNYSYGESVADDICRRVIFKPFDGQIEYKREDDEAFRVSTFADEIDPKDTGLRLWAACQTVSERGTLNNMLDEMLFKANRQLMDLRAAGHERAAGLIVCNEKSQARMVKKVMETISGHKVVLVLDDEPGSDDAINTFEHGFSPWMVAVRMVTEGVDIPRLRVGVYLSNVVQKLTFIQFIGRMVRHFKGDERTAGDPSGEGYVFFPGDERLKEIVRTIEDEVNEAILLRQAAGGEGGGGGEGGTGRYQAGNVSGDERENIIAGDLYSAEEIETADKMRVQWPNLAEEQILEMVKFVRAARPQPQRSQQQSSVFDDDEDHDTIRKECQRAAQRLAAIRGLEFNDVHTAANRAVGIGNIHTATIEQLKAKRAWLREQFNV